MKTARSCLLVPFQRAAMSELGNDSVAINTDRSQFVIQYSTLSKRCNALHGRSAEKKRSLFALGMHLNCNVTCACVNERERLSGTNEPVRTHVTGAF
jgi:hypothetical protein